MYTFKIEGNLAKSVMIPKVRSLGRTAFGSVDLRPTSTSVVLVGDVRVCLVRMLLSNRAYAKDKHACRRPELSQVEDGLCALLIIRITAFKE